MCLITFLNSNGHKVSVFTSIGITKVIGYDINIGIQFKDFIRFINNIILRDSCNQKFFMIDNPNIHKTAKRRPRA